MNKSVGIIGGGQLCKMLLDVSNKWNITVNILERDTEPGICNPTGTVIRGSFHDKNKIKELSDISDILTYEIEDINVDYLLELESAGKTIIPSPTILKTIKNKFTQKSFLINNQILVPMLKLCDNLLDLQQFMLGRDKLVLKKCEGGYNGDGVLIVDASTPIDIVQTFIGNNNESFICEEYIGNKREIAVVFAKTSLETVIYPVVEMVMNSRNTLDYQLCPANIALETQRIIDTTIHNISYILPVGLYSVEMFLTPVNLFVNEISPRVHNAGHNTIDDNFTSQFEQFWRVIFNLKLGKSITLNPSVMINILGPKDYTGTYTTSKHVLGQLLSLGNVYIHMYGKKYTKPNKKLGHLTILGNHGNNSYIQCQELLDKLIIPHKEENPVVSGKVAIIMGSTSDKTIMNPAIDLLNSFGVSCVTKIVSAHRTPDYMYEFAKEAHRQNIKVIIAGAGGAAHLPGMTAAICDSIPVIGVPVASTSMALGGLDSLYSIVQMPAGVPVATVAINGGYNAGILALQILASNRENYHIHEKLTELRKKVSEEVMSNN